MAGERATVLQRTQIGPEATPGTAVAATKRLGATTIAIQPQGNINRFAPQGTKFDTITAIGREWSALNISGYASYNDLAYLFSGLIRDVTPAQQGGTAAYLWTYSPRGGVADTVKTFTIEQGSPGNGGRAVRAPYGLLNSITLDWSREGVNISGDGLAQRIQDDIPLSTSATYKLTANSSPPTAGSFTLTFGGQTTAAIAFDATPAQVQSALEDLSTIGEGNVLVEATIAEGAGTLEVGDNVYTVTFTRALAAGPQTLTGTFSGLTASGSIALAADVVGAAPTLLAPAPVLGDQISVYVDDASGSLGTTKLKRAFAGSWAYSGRFGTVWPVNATVPSFDAHVELKPEARFNVRVAADDQGMALYTAMRTGDTKFIRWEAVGPTIASTYPYRLRIDMAGKVGDMATYSDQDGIYQIEFPFVLTDDSGWGKPFSVELQNTITAL